MSAMYEGSPVANEDVIEVYVILNGSLGMSGGKIAAQAFHCGWRLAGEGVASLVALRAWIEQGRRVSVRIAETAHVFERVTDECHGIEQQDEGLSEVERGSLTAFVTAPYRRGSAPKVLSHKRVQAYRG